MQLAWCRHYQYVKSKPCSNTPPKPERVLIKISGTRKHIRKTSREHTMGQHSLPHLQRSKPTILHNDKRSFQPRPSLDNSSRIRNDRHRNLLRIHESHRTYNRPYDTRNRRRRRNESLLRGNGRVNASINPFPVFVLYPADADVRCYSGFCCLRCVC